MLSDLILTIFCAFFSSSSRCKPQVSTPYIPEQPIQVTDTKTTSNIETYSELTSLYLKPGKNTFTLYTTAPNYSDGFQIHLKIDGKLTDLSVQKTSVEGISTLTSRAVGNEIWLAGITQNPTQPWKTISKVEVGKIILTSDSNSSAVVSIGSSSNILEHKTSQNLLDNNLSKVTIE